MELKGSKTEQNLISAFAGESMAANRYRLYAEKAHEEGYEQIKSIFQETSDNEVQHAKRILNFIQGIGNTVENLKAGAYGEHEEWTQIYKEMEAVAKEEGFAEIAAFFKNVATVEKEHEERYQDLLQLLQEKKVFQGDENTVWVCRNCGYVYVGKEPPKKCHVCMYPQGYFERKAENY
ncbi:rubrerythrin [Anaerotignum sp.]|uniref:rubrerythrin n=1 Tax=Anaerotignum sp. TaxID=2039241 RepID=UPI002714B659|nr:rubrerythrin family protein [Anaerotignum sp.]